MPDHNGRNAQQRKRIEIASRGIDESLQGIGGDPDGGISWAGLRVPALKNTAQTRYLFQLASFEVAEGQRARIIGMRQGWSIGYQQGTNAPYVNEFWVRSPIWKFQDGNVSWHLRKMGLQYPFPTGRPGPVFPPLQNLSFETSDTPALLYQVATGMVGGFYPTLTRYVPPNRGRPWGSAIGASLGTFNDLKVDWRDGSDWYSLDVPVEGPCRVAFYASVLQTLPHTSQNPASRNLLVVPNNTVAPFPLGLEPEEQFLQNFPAAIIWRVAGALLVELEDYKP